MFSGQRSSWGSTWLPLVRRRPQRHPVRQQVQCSTPTTPRTLAHWMRMRTVRLGGSSAFLPAGSLTENHKYLAVLASSGGPVLCPLRRPLGPSARPNPRTGSSASNAGMAFAVKTKTTASAPQTACDLTRGQMGAQTVETAAEALKDCSDPVASGIGAKYRFSSVLKWGRPLLESRIVRRVAFRACGSGGG
jgi:hypothetical protein